MNAAIDGVLRCSRYSFGPNRLHYCGPDANREMLDYLNAGVSDAGLETLLRAFKTLYPYLLLIAHSNNIADPFDARVVQAYWIGNKLLEGVPKRTLYDHLLREQELKKRLGATSFERIAEKLSHGAVPHHSFHVFSVWKRTGALERMHTVESMDSCRISWGRILRVDGPTVTVSVEPLLYENKRLCLGVPVEKKIYRSLESEFDVEQLSVGDLVSLHWGVICETITPREAAFLKHYTLRHITLANTTL